MVDRELLVARVLEVEVYVTKVGHGLWEEPTGQYCRLVRMAGRQRLVSVVLEKRWEGEGFRG